MRPILPLAAKRVAPVEVLGMEPLVGDVEADAQQQVLAEDVVHALAPHDEAAKVVAAANVKEEYMWIHVLLHAHTVVRR
jgi:hypothetical protein